VGAVTSEFDLQCATCGGALQEATVPAESVGVDGHESLSVAECAECGGRYFPERTLDMLGRTPET